MINFVLCLYLGIFSRLYATDTAIPDITTKTQFKTYTWQVENNCEKEVLTAGFALNKDTISACAEIQKTNLANDFNSCLMARPSILAFNEKFFRDCYQTAQQKKSVVYSNCLRDISKLNIDSIGDNLRELIYQANANQCYLLERCISKSLQNGSKIGTFEVDQCARKSNLSVIRDRQELPFKINLVPRKKCVFDMSGQQIQTKMGTQYNYFIKNYDNNSQFQNKHWTTGDCQ